MKTYIDINSLLLRGHHGVAPQERVVGNDFSLDIRIEFPCPASALEGDLLDGTISYADVVDIARKVMNSPSNLLENVAWRLMSELVQRFPAITGGLIRVAKLCPPMGAQLSSASFTIEW